MYGHVYPACFYTLGMQEFEFSNIYYCFFFVFFATFPSYPLDILITRSSKYGVIGFDWIHKLPFVFISITIFILFFIGGSCALFGYAISLILKKYSFEVIIPFFLNLFFWMISGIFITSDNVIYFNLCHDGARVPIQVDPFKKFSADENGIIKLRYIISKTFKKEGKYLMGSDQMFIVRRDEKPKKQTKTINRPVFYFEIK